MGRIVTGHTVGRIGSGHVGAGGAALSFSAPPGGREPAWGSFSGLLSLILGRFHHLARQELTFHWVSVMHCDKAAVGQTGRGLCGAGAHIS